MTVGDMIDQLTIANIKLWHIEDSRREYCQKEEKDESKAREFLDKVANINKERNFLIDQINAALGVLVDKAAKQCSSFRLTCEHLLGTGKNKFYYDESN
jgi:hypothetical protein